MRRLIDWRAPYEKITRVALNLNQGHTRIEPFPLRVQDVEGR